MRFIWIYPLTWALFKKSFSHFDSNILLLSSAVSHRAASWACRQIPPDVLCADWLSKLFPHWLQLASLIFQSWCRKEREMDYGWSGPSRVRHCCPPVRQLVRKKRGHNQWDREDRSDRRTAVCVDGNVHCCLPDSKTPENIQWYHVMLELTEKISDDITTDMRINNHLQIKKKHITVQFTNILCGILNVGKLIQMWHMSRFPNIMFGDTLWKLL